MQNKPNKIWIELDQIQGQQHAELQCELANNMLKKLGIKEMEFWVGDYRGKPSYNIRTSSDGTYLTCPDRGHWFNLDYIAK